MLWSASEVRMELASRCNITKYVNKKFYYNSSILTLLADSNITSMTNTYCCKYSIKAPDDGR